MAIDEYFSREDELTGLASHTYVVHDHVMVFDRPLADAINHMYNHLAVLFDLANGAFSYLPMMFLSKNHPSLRGFVQEFAEEMANGDKTAMDATRLDMINQLVYECHFLIEILAKIAWQTDDGEKVGDEQISHLEHVLATIPFIDYSTTPAERPSKIKYHRI